MNFKIAVEARPKFKDIDPCASAQQVEEEFYRLLDRMGYEGNISVQGEITIGNSRQ